MPSLSFSAWLAPDDAAAWASFEAHADLLARAYPLWYLSGPQGLPLRRPDAGQEARRRLSALARGHGVELWPHIGVQDSHQGLPGEGERREHALALLRLAQEDGAQGVDLDYGTIPATEGDGFKALVAEVCAAFHGAGLKAGVVARVRPGLPGVDVSLASVCDRLQILGPYPGLGLSGPDAPAPLAAPDWCAEVLARAVSLAPPGKLEWGLPGCGCDWGPGASASDLPWDRWEPVVKAHPPERRDPVSAELKLLYEGREVWTNDAISLTAKLWQVRLHGVSSAALWGLGAEDPRLWALLDSLPKDFLGTEEA